jgi:hypothetical protein
MMECARRAMPWTGQSQVVADRGYLTAGQLVFGHTAADVSPYTITAIITAASRVTPRSISSR